MSGEILYDEEVLEKLQEGLDKVVGAVKPTLGPKGRNVGLEKMLQKPQITNDGAYIMRELEFEGEDFSAGAESIKQASIRTSENSGDGTTSSAILVHELFSESRKSIVSGIHPNFLKRGMQKALDYAVEFAYDFSFPVQDPEEISHVASVSAGGDEPLGELIAEAIEMVGKDGIIQVEESEGVETYLEFSEGVQLDRGYIAHDFVENTEEDQVEMDDAFVYLADKRLTSAQDVLRPMEYAKKNNKPLFVMAHDVEDQALATLIQNHNEGNLDCCAVKAPRVAEKRTEILDSVGVLTNAAVVSDETGISPIGSDPDLYVGKAKSIKIDRNTTTLIGGSGKKEDIKSKIKSLRTKLNQSGSEHDKEFYQKMVSQMSGGMAMIKAGGKTEIELKEYKADVEDALSATKAAVRSGIIPGGGVTYLEIRDFLQEILEEDEVEFVNYEEKRGWEIFTESLEVIFEKLLKNGGYSPDKELYKYKQKKDEDSGYVGQVFDVRDGKVKNAYEAGIIEPTLVLKDVLSNAVSVASTLITSSCMVIKEGEEEDEDELNGET